MRRWCGVLVVGSWFRISGKCSAVLRWWHPACRGDHGWWHTVYSGDHTSTHAHTMNRCEPCAQNTLVQAGASVWKRRIHTTEIEHARIVVCIPKKRYLLSPW